MSNDKTVPPIALVTERDIKLNELIDRRVEVYGEPVGCFVRIAQVWTGILGVTVQPYQVPLCMTGLKAVRSSITPDYSDNSDDIDGYLDIFRQLVGEDMIHARSVVDYLKQKDARA